MAQSLSKVFVHLVFSTKKPRAVATFTRSNTRSVMCGIESTGRTPSACNQWLGTVNPGRRSLRELALG
jgi:hypothetical protein